MYNRYIPGPGGVYQRQTVQEPEKRREPEPCPEPPPPCPDRAEEKPCPAQGRQNASFLRRFLPPGLDLGDLLLLCIVLLLLMDCEEDDTMTVLLTIAAFCFL